MASMRIDAELDHLERVLPRVLQGPMSLDYWRQRLEVLERTITMPQHRSRIARLLCELDRIDAVLRSSRIA